MRIIEKDLGKILHIIEGEAITRPNKHIRAPRSIVITEDRREIGRLGEPFGPVERPYQAIRLRQTTDETIIGLNAIVLISKKSNKTRRKKPRKFKSDTKKHNDKKK
ncbi:MAG: hypothetical protein OEY49_10740 [Candidatus Heimdallarchaeota archaeon]|nr:hypothetical protein [Candidatus Heimdallarchaeota archaeon]